MVGRTGRALPEPRRRTLSGIDWNPELQLDALTAVDRERDFEDRVSRACSGQLVLAVKLDGLKVWPIRSPVPAQATEAWRPYLQSLRRGGGDVRLGEPYRAHQEHPTMDTWHADAVL